MDFGGIETMIVDFARMALAAGWRPEVAVMRGDGSLEERLRAMDVPVHLLRKREGLDPLLALRLARLLRQRRIDLLHTNNYSAWLYGVAARTLVHARHVHSEHSRETGLRRRAIEAVLSWFTHAIVAVSKDVLDHLEGLRLARRTRFHFVGNGVNTVRFAPCEGRRDRERRTLGWHDELVVFGIVARLAPIKNHAMLLKALADLEADVQPAARLLVVGDGPLRQALVDLAASLGVTDLVHFAGARHDTESVLNAMDVYVLPSTSEGMNLTLIEAMASGLPCIATRVGGNPEVVEEHANGLLVESGNHLELSQAMGRLIRDRGLRETFGRAGRVRATTHFDERDTMRRYLGLYEGEPCP
jgi:sugar transferase (PEP-CTERM/EpsH1 system associated)